MFSLTIEKLIGQVKQKSQQTLRERRTLWQLPAPIPIFTNIFYEQHHCLLLLRFLPLQFLLCLLHFRKQERRNRNKKRREFASGAIKASLKNLSVARTAENGGKILKKTDIMLSGWQKCLRYL